MPASFTASGVGPHPTSNQRTNMGSFSTISAVIDIVKTILPIIQQLSSMS
ncbi:hypothetical protein [Rhodococcus sp. ABRD24]|nr:hypothetical protein [Rhodococcus sp. ABRD24]